MTRPAWPERRGGPGRVPTVVVLRALGLGDFLAALPALRAVDDAFPGHHRILAMPPALEPLARLARVADEVLPAWGTGGVEPLDDRWAARTLSSDLDVAVNLHGCGPESHRALLSLDPRRLIAFAHPDIPASEPGPVWREKEHEVARWCRLLEESGIATQPERLELTPPPLDVLACSELAVPVRGATIIHPGAGSPARCWPPERWAEVAREEQRRGRMVLLTGGPAEVDVAWKVASLAALPPQAVLAGRTTLVELVALVGAAGLVLSGDTGIAHLATAVGTASVVLFGPTSPALWGPPSDRPIHEVLWAGIVGDPHAPRPHPGLLKITVEQVLDSVERARSAALDVSRA